MTYAQLKSEIVHSGDEQLLLILKEINKSIMELSGIDETELRSEEKPKQITGRKYNVTRRPKMMEANNGQA